MLQLFYFHSITDIYSYSWAASHPTPIRYLRCVFITYSHCFPINKMKFFVFVLYRLLTYGKYLINSRRNPVVSKISMRKVRRMRSTLSNAGRISIRT